MECKDCLMSKLVDCNKCKETPENRAIVKEMQERIIELRKSFADIFTTQQRITELRKSSSDILATKEEKKKKFTQKVKEYLYNK